MPTRPQINNAYRVLLKFTVSDLFLGETHFDFVIPTFPFDDVSCGDLVDMIGTALTTNNVNDALSDEVRIPEWTVQNFDDPTRADITIPSSFQGGETGQILPENVAALVSLRTPLRGRSHRGRAYWPGYTEASADGSAFSPTSAGNLASAYADVVTGVDGLYATAHMAVLSMKLATASAVSSILVEASFATMRKRLSRIR